MFDPAASPRLFRALLFAGLILRAAGLPLRGTVDMDVWKLWTYAGSTDVIRIRRRWNSARARRARGTSAAPSASAGHALCAVARRTCLSFARSCLRDSRAERGRQARDSGRRHRRCVALWRLMRRGSPRSARGALLLAEPRGRARRRDPRLPRSVARRADDGRAAGARSRRVRLVRRHARVDGAHQAAARPDPAHLCRRHPPARRSARLVETGARGNGCCGRHDTRRPRAVHPHRRAAEPDTGRRQGVSPRHALSGAGEPLGS